MKCTLEYWKMYQGQHFFKYEDVNWFIFYDVGIARLEIDRENVISGAKILRQYYSVLSINDPFSFS